MLYLKFCARYFAGVANVTAAFTLFHMDAFAYELKHDHRLHNILGKKGFVLAGTLLYRLRPTAAVLLAPVCSTWVYLARSKTLRSHAFPLGYEGYTASGSVSHLFTDNLQGPCGET